MQHFWDDQSWRRRRIAAIVTAALTLLCLAAYECFGRWWLWPLAYAVIANIAVQASRLWRHWQLVRAGRK